MARFAGPVDYRTYGRYGERQGFPSGQSFVRPRYRFQGRITADGSSGFQAQPGRYHLYIAWECPWAQRSAIVRKLEGIEDVVSLSYVDHERDGRGWAFREATGPDSVNGFTFLAEAYEATEPGYDGHVSVPVLWDRRTGSIVSNNFPDITIDLGTQFGEWADADVQLYPPALRPQIDELNDEIYEAINDGGYRVAGATSAAEYERLRRRYVAAMDRLDQRLAGQRYLFGRALTESDVRLWVTLARFDRGYNRMAKISERSLPEFPSLWAYARDLYRIPAFGETTDLTVFDRFADGPPHSFFNDGDWRITPPDVRPDWNEPPARDALG
jgi:glutathione S-transferase/putative glutathione S-transferase